MKTSFKIENPEKVNLTLSVTMPLEDWMALRMDLGELPQNYPADTFSRNIASMINKAEREYSITDPDTWNRDD